LVRGQWRAPPNASCAAWRSAEKNGLFAGSEGGGEAAAIALKLIETAKLNKVDPQA
jgi:hypothetical protein